MTDVVPLRRKPKATKFPEGFVVGARVQLLSRGGVMTITELLTGSPLVVNCEWHTADFYPQEKAYPVAALRVVSDEEIEGLEEEDAEEAPAAE